jgi:hypothetical protein
MTSHCRLSRKGRGERLWRSLRERQQLLMSFPRRSTQNVSVMLSAVSLEPGILGTQSFLHEEKRATQCDPHFGIGRKICRSFRDCDVLCQRLRHRYVNLPIPDRFCTL